MKRVSLNFFYLKIYTDVNKEELRHPINTFYDIEITKSLEQIVCMRIFTFNKLYSFKFIGVKF